MPDRNASGSLRLRPASAPLLTAVACAMGAFLALKLGHIVFKPDPVPFTIGQAIAQEAKSDADTQADSKKAGAGDDAQAKPEDGAKTADGTAGDKDGEKKQAADTTGEKVPDEVLNGNTTKTEVDVMQRLAERRQQLEARAQKLELREKLLKATEKKLQEKLDELKQLEARIAAAVETEKKERSDEFKDLVALYENMKPKQAATIFNRLDMDVLLSVAQNMKTRKMSAILAQMNTEVAQRLTVELVARVSGAGAAAKANELPGVAERNPG